MAIHQRIENLNENLGKPVELLGWVANKRTGKGLVFIEMRDGSGFCQCVIEEGEIDETQFEEARRLGLASAVRCTGVPVADDRQIGGVELKITSIDVLQNVEDYPISNKAHGIDFLIEQRHLWLRSKRQWAVLRIRSRAKFAIHQFFQSRGFVQMDSPIFTGSAAEGTTTLFETDFYGQKAYLAQTGQLYAEAGAMSHGLVYTFGPTFRAEKSKTRRHLSEFWMIEPEMAFYDLDDNMELIEEFVRAIVTDIYKNCRFELELLGRDEKLFKRIDQPFPKLTYSDAVELLTGRRDHEGRNAIALLEDDLRAYAERKREALADIEDREAKIAAGGMKKGAINFNRNKIDTLKNEVKALEEHERNLPQWIESARNFEHGNDFGGSDETVLTRLFETPVMVYNWPQEIKAFYMKRTEGDDRFVKGVDCLAPDGFGEIVGGSERETDIDLLLQRIDHEGLDQADFEWYLDLRRYGSVPHSGFGLGFERLVMWLTGVDHIRETIPFPRYYGRLFP